MQQAQVRRAHRASGVPEVGQVGGGHGEAVPTNGGGRGRRGGGQSSSWSWPSWTWVRSPGRPGALNWRPRELPATAGPPPSQEPHAAEGQDQHEGGRSGRDDRAGGAETPRSATRPTTLPEPRGEPGVPAVTASLGDARPAHRGRRGRGGGADRRRRRRRWRPWVSSAPARHAAAAPTTTSSTPSTSTTDRHAGPRPPRHRPPRPRHRPPRPQRRRPPDPIAALPGVGASGQVITVTTAGYGTDVATVTGYAARGAASQRVFGPWQGFVGVNGPRPAGAKARRGRQDAIGNLRVRAVLLRHRPGSGWDPVPVPRRHGERLLERRSLDRLLQPVDRRRRMPGNAPEHLIDQNPSYDYAAVIGYNTSPVVANPPMGSAIFFHVSDRQRHGRLRVDPAGRPGARAPVARPRAVAADRHRHRVVARDQLAPADSTARRACSLTGRDT